MPRGPCVTVDTSGKGDVGIVVCVCVTPGRVVTYGVTVRVGAFFLAPNQSVLDNVSIGIRDALSMHKDVSGDTRRGHPGRS